MEKPYEFLKVEAEEALQVLDECIVSGYKVKDEINGEYYPNKPVDGERLTKLREKANVWANETIKELRKIYASIKEQYNFRDAKTKQIIVNADDIDYFPIIGNLEARIELLNKYFDFILQHMQVKVKAKRDVYLLNAPFAKVQVKN